MPAARSVLRWLSFSAGLGVFAAFAGVFILCCGAVPLNQLKLWRLWRAYAEVPHPPDSTALQTYAQVGLLDGNGNHCDFIAGEQRRSGLSAGELVAFYAPWPELELYIPGVEGSQLASSVVLDTPDWPAGSYAVYRFEWGHSDDFDIRCH